MIWWKPVVKWWRKGLKDWIREIQIDREILEGKMEARWVPSGSDSFFQAQGRLKVAVLNLFIAILKSMGGSDEN